MKVLTPEVGLLFGADRGLGRILLGVTGFVPLQHVDRPADSTGEQIAPPRVAATALLSF